MSFFPEEILTFFLILGIIAAVIWFFFRAVHTVFKILGNSLAGLVLFFLLHTVGPYFGLELPVNLITVLISLVGGVFGVIAMTVFYLFF